MKILFLHHGGTNASDRLTEFQRLGHEVTTELLYPERVTTADQLWYRVAYHFKTGPWVQQANLRLQDLVTPARGFDLIWLEKSLYVRSETIEAIRRSARCPVVQFTPDMAIQIRESLRSPIYLDAVTCYDAVITTKDFEVDGYQALGARRVILTEKAVNHRRFSPGKPVPPSLQCDVGFIGRREKHYMKVLLEVERAGLPLQVRGPGWESRLHRLHPDSGTFPRGPAVGGAEYGMRLTGMKIGLGFLSKLGPETITARSFEIPAAGTFLLAERTQKHQETYKEGTEAEFFGSADELIDKAKFYLRNDSAREAIAAAGHQRFLNSDARLDRQMTKLLGQLQDAFDIA